MAKAYSYIMRTKWVALLAAVLLLIVFGRTVNSPALTKSAIVLGVGIDYDEDARQFIVTAQSAIMATSSSSDSGATTSYVTYTCTGKTKSSALDDISTKMGLIVSLAHCEVLFVSKSVLKLDRLQLIYPLTGMYALREQAVVLTGDTAPREMLALRVGTSISAPFYLQTALTNMEGTDGMIRTTVKTLLARSLSRSRAAVIPYLSAKKMQDQPIDQEGEQKDNYEFDLSRTLAFNYTDSYVLEKDLSEILAIYLSTTTYGALNYTSDKGESVDFRLLKKNVKTSAKGRSVTVEIKLTADLLDVQFVDTDKVLTGADKPIKDAAKALAKQLEDRMTALYEKSKQLNIDFLGLQAKAYQSVGRSLEEDCLSTISFTPKITIDVKEAA